MVNMYIFDIEIGDPSNDGHGEYDKVKISCSHTKMEVEEAYEKSCKKTKLVFHENYELINPNYHWEDFIGHAICVDWEDSKISEENRQILENHKVQLTKEDYAYEPQEFANLMMEFAGISLPGLTWRILSPETKTPPFKYTIGYGILGKR